jgi:hypothetical protein
MEMSAILRTCSAEAAAVNQEDPDEAQRADLIQPPRRTLLCIRCRSDVLSRHKQPPRNWS